MDLRLGDCREIMGTMDDCSVDAIVTDPPYELGFMGKRWDGTGVAYDGKVWGECLRVVKPGGWIVAFGGTRTWHRLTCAIEDAGWEIRDCLMWLYGSGFPKSLDVSKAIDKAAGAKGELGGPKTAAHAGWIDRGRMRGDGGHNGYQRPWMQDADKVDANARVYLPATPAAAQWSGWGTALKPAWEPIVLARKPLVGTVAKNVLEHGTGGLNIDGCRVGTETITTHSRGQNTAFPKVPGAKSAEDYGATKRQDEFDSPARSGRWPANVILDPEAGALLDQMSGTLKSGSRKPGTYAGLGYQGSESADFPAVEGNEGGASRFFYCAKASRADRNRGLPPYVRNSHPTVKPHDLMRYLCRLITPPSGVILDPFMGSGSTGAGAVAEGFGFIGIDAEPRYIAIARHRIRGAA